LPPSTWHALSASSLASFFAFRIAIALVCHRIGIGVVLDVVGMVFSLTVAVCSFASLSPLSA
jgi:hypothetical protein